MARRLDDLKVAIVADWLTDRGGAERVILLLAEIFPQADIFTSVFKESAFPELRGRQVFTTYLQSWPLHFRHQIYSWARPKAFESLNLDDYDLVISSSSAEAKGVITQPSTLHICYCHTPTRYYWSHYHEYLKTKHFGVFDPLVKLFMPSMIHRLREWDRVAADRVDFFIANSEYVQKRISKYYHMPSTVIYPPVDFYRFNPAHTPKSEDFYLVVGRQIPYKRTDLVVEAFNKLGKHLKIVGEGPELPKLKKLAAGNEKIEFLGRISDQEATEYFLSCRALIFPQKEDFGIVPLEAMAAGKPVIAYGAGGALETVVNGKTGVLFSQQTSTALIDAIEQFEKLNIFHNDCREQAQKFDQSVFKRKIKEFVQAHLDAKPEAQPL